MGLTQIVARAQEKIGRCRGLALASNKGPGGSSVTPPPGRDEENWKKKFRTLG